VRGSRSSRSILGRGAAAGGIAAAAWAIQQPLDKRAFRSGYDDVELLGKAIARRRWWPIPGLAIHLANGCVFGALYAVLCRRIGRGGWWWGLVAAQIENFGLWPLVQLTDRYHPARRELTRLSGNRRALAQATWRHALFGFVLGMIADGPTDDRDGQ
jgi:hypothetical protein